MVVEEGVGGVAFISPYLYLPVIVHEAGMFTGIDSTHARARDMHDHLSRENRD